MYVNRVGRSLGDSRSLTRVDGGRERERKRERYRETIPRALLNLPACRRAQLTAGGAAGQCTRVVQGSSRNCLLRQMVEGARGSF